MVPGPKSGAKRRQLEEELEVTGYERVRAEKMAQNNQVFQSLGISTLSSVVKKSVSKSTKKAKARENSSSLYEPGDSDDNDQDVVDTVMQVSEDVPYNISTTCVGGSKRVRATSEQVRNRSPRITRQRIRELSVREQGLLDTTTTTQEDPLIPTNCETQPNHETRICNEGESSRIADRWSRGPYIGRELERINRGLNSRLPVIIAEGKKRPDAPMQAAKLASEGGIVLRQHMPILSHWKEYKKDKSLVANYMGKVAAQFVMDTNSKPVKEACTDLLKTGQRQMRHKLKKVYFDGKRENEVRTTSPTNNMTDEQWMVLVKLWSSSEHKERCATNARNREKVRFYHTTGSRSYNVAAHVAKQTNYKDEPPTAIDLFKITHCSSRTGLSDTAKEAVATVEAIVAAPVEEGQVSKTPTEAVAQVMPNSKFLQSVGVQVAAPKRSNKAVADAHVQKLEAQLEVERQEKALLNDKVEALEKKFEDNEEARLREIQEMKKAQDETNAFLRRLCMFNNKSRE